MRKLSLKRQKQNREYLKIRKQYLLDQPYCQAIITGCEMNANQIHHQKGRIGELLNNTDHFLAVCENCHRWIENNPIKAKELGLSISRLGK